MTDIGKIIEEELQKPDPIPRHCMVCDKVYHKGVIMPAKEYRRLFNNKDYTTGICGGEGCIDTYLNKYVNDEALRQLIREDIQGRSWKDENQ